MDESWITLGSVSKPIQGLNQGSRQVMFVLKSLLVYQLFDSFNRNKPSKTIKAYLLSPLTVSYTSFTQLMLALMWISQENLTVSKTVQV